MQMTRTTIAIWILALTAVGIVGVMAANQLFSLGWGRAHDAPLPFAAVGCIVTCLLLARQKQS